MILSVLSLVMIVLLTGYIGLVTYKRKEKLNGMSGMMIAMAVGMISSLALGFHLGIVLQHGLEIPSIIAILFGLGAGYIIGKPISLMAALDGMLAGIMGGLMGAMLGAMLSFSYIMVLFIDILFIFILSVVLQLANQETDQAHEVKKKGINLPFISGILMVGFGALSIGILLFFQLYDNPTTAFQSHDAQSSDQSTVQENVGYQIVSIDVTAKGFSQENIKIKAGVPTKINFIKHSGYTCIKSIESIDLGLDVYLEKGDNFVTLNDLKPGTYQFNCGMYMYYGTITVT